MGCARQAINIASFKMLNEIKVWSQKINSRFYYHTKLTTSSFLLIYSSKESNETPFLQACEQGDLRTVHSLLTAAATQPTSPTNASVQNLTTEKFIPVDVNILDTQLNQTGLHKAAAGGHLPIIRRLLAEPNININAQDALGMTQLAWACVSGEVQAADKLLRSFADPNVVDKEGCSPLMLALAAPLWRCLYASEIQREGIISVISRLRALSQEQADREYAVEMAAAGLSPSLAAQHARQQYGALY
jgi:ankyrin repeat protein